MARLIEQHMHPELKQLYVQQRSDSRWLQAVAYVGGQKKQFSTRTQHLPTAFRLAEDWYKRQLRVWAGEEKRKDPLSIPIMEELFEQWKLELSPVLRKYKETKWGAIARFWEARRVSEINAQTFKEFYRWRRQQPKPPKNMTLHHDVVLVRQILKYAVEEQHIATVPAIPTVGKIEPNPRPWLTRAEWAHLKVVSGRRILAAKNPRLNQQRRELDDELVWMVNTMMRVEEMAPAKPNSTPVRFSDCRITKGADGKDILVCEVRGKRGQRTVVCRKPALDIYNARKGKGYRTLDRYIFPVHHREALTELLIDAGLHVDRISGFKRNFKSFRCTAISFAVLEGIDLMWIARNAGTSVAMIDAFYARRLSAEMAKDVLTQPWKEDD